MLSQRLIELLVGLFLLIAFIALTILAFKVSGLTSLFPGKSYVVTAAFDDIGGLKVRSPIKIGGVQIGEVTNIKLDPVTFKAIVSLRISDEYNTIPDDSSAGIFTAGLLGDNYIAITPMYNKVVLKNGSTLEFTNSALVLEKLIGQLLYRVGDKETTRKN
ncbi:MAG: outer membrane lipid asymmetry maintenance protein MlaD [Gammaproteobacteria bacterium RIFCSPHIGHO2_12_FULL_37_14]|nr:MAG: outer membrane lipid asymmetry maintenance protein MlaD [Gammaproteobacteria bacterium RIFCSPHIGHO2_12_FULL_37_14]